MSGKEERHKVIGPNTGNGDTSVWHFPNRTLADVFAKQLASDTGGDVIVTKVVGTWRRVNPVVFVED
jgi:hypothetical protein